MNSSHLVRRRERGLTLVEIAVATIVLAATAMGVSASMMSGIAANRLYRENTLVMARAQHYLETFNNLQIGQTADAVASDSQIALVFSGDPDIGSNPPTLASLTQKIDGFTGDVYEFTPPNLGFAGTFLVTVSNNVEPTLLFPLAVDSDQDGVPDEGDAPMTVGSSIEQYAGQGCFENTTSDDSRELYMIEVSWRPSVPANATPRLLLRGYRCQDY